MRETFTAVLFPFVMCVIVGLMSKVKSKKKKDVCADYDSGGGMGACAGAVSVEL